MQISNFFLFDVVFYYFIFHSGFSKRNFWCKELIPSSKIGKVSNFSPISVISLLIHGKVNVKSHTDPTVMELFSFKLQIHYEKAQLSV